MEPYNRQTASTFVGRAPISETTTSGVMYSQAPEENRKANMPATAGILPLTKRAGNPQSTYRLNKIETPRPNTEYVYFHLEKYCTLDALWYPQWLKLSIYCAMTREILMAVINAAMERPERTHFLLTLTRVLALPDLAPRAEGNPLSTRFHWKSPMHEVMWSWLQAGESPWDFPYQMYPQPPARPRVDIATFQRAMFTHLLPSTSATPATTTATPTTSTATIAETVTQELEVNVEVESDTDSVDTTAAVIFTPPRLTKKDIKRPVPISPPGAKKNQPGTSAL